MSTLFVNPQQTIESFQWYFKRPASLAFFKAADEQLTREFERLTGLKASKHVSLVLPHAENFIIEVGPVSRMPITIYVNHNWNQAHILWKSKSGRIYDVNDEDIDPGDIEFSFEQLDPLLYRKQLYPGDQLPFKLKGLTYELVVTRLNREATIEMQLKDGKLPEANQIISQVYDFVNGYNDKAMRNAKGYDGVVHNIAGNSGGDTITFEVDMGTAGPHFYEKLLPFVSDFNALTKLEIL